MLFETLSVTNHMKHKTLIISLLICFFAGFYFAHWNLGEDVKVICEELEEDLPKAGMSELQSKSISLQFRTMRNTILSTGLILGFAFTALGVSAALALSSSSSTKDKESRNKTDNQF